jgi:nucleotide-binding universal stress UspA family protein
MYKDIVVCINEYDYRDNTIKAALRLACEIKANLPGLYVRVSTAPAVGPYGYISEEVAEEIRIHDVERTAAAKDSFDSISGELGDAVSWLEIDENQRPLMATAYADLVITNHVSYDPYQGGGNTSFVNNLILETGKPIVLIPNDWHAAIFGSKIVVGWDGSRGAIRAIHDAMPLLQKVDHVEVVCVNHKDVGEAVDVSQISPYLTRRNVSNSFTLAVTADLLNTPEKVLHSEAGRLSADLIVVGGYGHSGLREIILGGVTRYLTKNSTVPVLFLH